VIIEHISAVEVDLNRIIYTRL